MDGKFGIIHLDRHLDTQEKDIDEIMHTCPWFHATNMPNCPPGQPGAVGDRRLASPSLWREGGTRARHHVPDCQRDREDRGCQDDRNWAASGVEGGPPNAVIDVIDITVRHNIGDFPCHFTPRSKALAPNQRRVVTLGQLALFCNFAVEFS